MRNIKYDILIEIRVIRTQLLWVYTKTQRMCLNLSRRDDPQHNL